MASRQIPNAASGKTGKSGSSAGQTSRRVGRPAESWPQVPVARSANPRRIEAVGSFATISRRAADRLRAGHVWVYRSDLEQVVADAGESRLTAVLDPRGQPLGTALYSSSSQIALRMISTGVIDETAWMELFRERLRAAIQSRTRMRLDHGTDSCRLVFSEADFLPGLIVDRYNDLVVVQLLTQGMATAAIRKEAIEVLGEEIGLKAIFERTDARIQEIEELPSAASGAIYHAEGIDADDDLSSTIFHLNNLSFLFDASSGQKTGAFLDQRENYAAAALYCRGEALDVCTYQGGFALHLAQVCPRVTGVDASRSALEVAERNLAINQETHSGTPVDWIEANAFDLLREWSQSGVQFDSIVLDPPAFAKSKRAAEGALRGYKELNLRALKMLRPGGTLVTCSCSHHVGIEEFTSVVAAAAGDARRHVRLLERRGAAADHPVLLNVPETEYLKCLICRVD